MLRRVSPAVLRLATRGMARYHFYDESIFDRLVLVMVLVGIGSGNLVVQSWGACPGFACNESILGGYW